MKIARYSKSDLWAEGLTEDGFWFQAKVYNTGSQFGINKGRVSKLSVCQGTRWNPETQVYNYDRGLDFDRAPNGLVDRIVQACETLPPI